MRRPLPLSVTVPETVSAPLPVVASPPGRGSLPLWRSARVVGGMTAALALGGPPAASWAAAAPQAAAAPATPAVIVSPAPAPVAVPVPEPPLSEAVFAARLASDDLAGLDDLCRRSVAADEPSRLRRLHARLLGLYPAPQPLPLVLANAEIGRAHV